jgi:hypothetical protein
VKSGVGVEVGRSAEALVELPIAFSATLRIGLGLGGDTVAVAVKSGVSVEVGRSAEAPVELPIAFSATLWIGLGLGGDTVSGGEPRTVCH